MRVWLLGLFGLILSGLIVSSIIYSQKAPPPLDSRANPISQVSAVSSAPPAIAPPPAAIGTGPSPSASGMIDATVSNPNPDLTADASGLSKATVLMTTTTGIIKFKFYPNDAPKTVKRMVELINKGFFNGLTFHRVVPGFVVQGGDPMGNGTGGSGQKLDAEFNNRRHIEGAVAMARASDPNSADSQFYISLGTFPHLDHNYTVFGQVVEGLDTVRKLKVGDKMMNVMIQ